MTQVPFRSGGRWPPPGLHRTLAAEGNAAQRYTYRWSLPNVSSAAQLRARDRRPLAPGRLGIGTSKLPTVDNKLPDGQVDYGCRAGTVPAPAAPAPAAPTTALWPTSPDYASTHKA
jgi:hypothetical protein